MNVVPPQNSNFCLEITPFTDSSEVTSGRFRYHTGKKLFQGCFEVRVMFTCPQDPAVLETLRVVNSLRVVNLLSHCDLLSRHTLCGHHFLGIHRHFSSQKKGPQRSNMGGGHNETPLRSNLLFFYRRSMFSTEGSFGWL